MCARGTSWGRVVLGAGGRKRGAILCPWCQLVREGEGEEEEEGAYRLVVVHSSSLRSPLSHSTAMAATRFGFDVCEPHG